jgi:hypothetical protein
VDDVEARDLSGKQLKVTLANVYDVMEVVKTTPSGSLANQYHLFKTKGFRVKGWPLCPTQPNRWILSAKKDFMYRVMTPAPRLVQRATGLSADVVTLVLDYLPEMRQQTAALSPLSPLSPLPAASKPHEGSDGGGSDGCLIVQRPPHPSYTMPFQFTESMKRTLQRQLLRDFAKHFALERLDADSGALQRLSAAAVELSARKDRKRGADPNEIVFYDHEPHFPDPREGQTRTNRDRDGWCRSARCATCASRD